MTANPSRALSSCCPGKRIALALISPCNLAKATADPEKAMAPISRPSDDSSQVSVPAIISARAIKTADNPPKPLNAAIICGNEVILTLRALTVPMMPPMAIAPNTHRISLTSGEQSVAATAIIMPMMPRTLPRRAVSGEASPRMAKMNKMLASK